MAKKGKEDTLTKKPDTEEDKDFTDLPEEGTKSDTPVRESVRGEDVLKILREKGMKI